MSLRRLAHTIAQTRGWRRALIAFIAGLVSVVALPPFHLWPVLFLTFPVLVWLIDGAGPGWRGVTARAPHRLAVRLRVSGRRALLDRPRVSGRRADVRLDAAVCGSDRAGRTGDFSRRRHCTGATALDARRATHPRARGSAHSDRMAARARTHGLSVEYVRLCADGAAGAGTRRGTDRHLGPDVPGDCRLRVARRARRRSRRHQASRGCR